MENQVPPVSDAELAALYFTERLTRRREYSGMLGRTIPDSGPYARTVGEMLWPFHPTWHKPSHQGIAGQFMPAVAGRILNRLCHDKLMSQPHIFPRRSYDYIVTSEGLRVLAKTERVKERICAYQEKSLRQTLKRYYGDGEFIDWSTPGNPKMTADKMVERLEGWQMAKGLR